MDLFSSIPDPEDNKGSDPPGPKVYSVAEITRQIKFLIEESFPSLVVRGEVSNLSLHSSGHVYFTLKDEAAQIKCVIWRSQAERMGVALEDGMKVLAKGKLSLYEKGGYYQITVSGIQPEGIGELQLAFEKLKKKLYAEGLFNEEHKKPIPEYPETVAIITSPTGAAIRDVVSVIRRRWPAVQLVLMPVKVQGDGASEEIAQAIEDLDRWGKADVLIVGRGGGSLEDLWAFNEERVARAIFRCTTPVISAVGHEIDYTIADFVADVRAATPSAAAELAVPERSEIMQSLANLRYTLVQNCENTIDNYRERLRHYEDRYAFRRPENIIEQFRQQTDEIERRLIIHTRHRLGTTQQSLEHMERQLAVLNPKNTLRRGYTITRQHDKIVPRAAELSSAEKASVEFFDRTVEVKIVKK